MVDWEEPTASATSDSVIPSRRRAEIMSDNLITNSYSFLNTMANIYPNAFKMQPGIELMENKRRPTSKKQESMSDSDTIIAALNRIIDRRSLSIAEVARMSGVSQPTAHRILSGQSKSPKMGNLNLLCEALGTSIQEILAVANATGTSETGRSYEIGPKNTVPLYTVNELHQLEDTNRTTVCPFTHNQGTYAFTVDGNPNGPTPMHPTYGKAYPVGSIVFVDPALSGHCKSGDIVAVRLEENNLFAFRMLVRDDAGGEQLFALNPQFPQIDPTTRPYRIVGKIIGAILP